MPLSSNCGISPPSWVCGLESETVTRAPRACRTNAAAAPDLPSPTTKTRLSLISITRLPLPALIRLCHDSRALAQLQCGKSKECKYQGRYPEAHDDLRFRPSQQLKM